MGQRNWDIILEFIKDKKNILITTHTNPDGDAIGSQVALAEYLKQQGKNCFLINCSITPKFFHFLDPKNSIQRYKESDHQDLFKSLDGVIIVDISDWPRLCEVGKAIKKQNLPVAIIDHHITSDDMGPTIISDPTASSTGELIYDFLNTNNCQWDQLIVNALYTCILTDTGSFRFTNTTSRTHRVTADLIDKGAECSKVYKHIYESYSPQRSILMGKMLGSLKFEKNDQIVWYVLTQDLLKESGAEYWETEGFSELSRNIKNVQITIMFVETQDGRIKVSFRSKGEIAINNLAQKFGGGGHKFAAGATLELKLEDAIHKVLEETKILV
jgi:bifunctional oligoribonuclease and PAP phosphatase NrnA